MSQEWRFISIEKKLRREKQKSEPFIVNLYLSSSVVFLMYVTMLCQLRAARLHLLDPYQQEGTDPLHPDLRDKYPRQHPRPHQINGHEDVTHGLQTGPLVEV